MATAYSKQIQRAMTNIAKKGMLVKWRIVKDLPSDNPDEPWKSTEEAEPVEKDVYVLFLPVNKEMRETLRSAKGSEVQIGSEMGLMASQDFEPNIKDVVIRNDEELGIEYIDILQPDGTPILYTILFKS